MQSNIRDNHVRGSVADFLREHLHPQTRLSFVSAYFTIYAYYALREQFDQIEHLDFLFGEPSFLNKLDPEAREAKAFAFVEDTLSLTNVLTQRAAARACAEWITQKVSIKSIVQQNLMHGKMYYIQHGPVAKAIMGSSNFTVRGLGLTTDNNNYELNMVVDSDRDRADLLHWFNHLWDNPKLVKDVKAEVLQYLNQVYSNHSPEFIYYKTLYHIFEQYLNDTAGTIKDIGQTSLYTSQIWQALFDFQRDGVKGAINKIQAYNGCIIADSVGLGKTYEALAVIKYYELKNERVLVICPRRLRENWTIYTQNTQMNPFIHDRFRFDVVSHTDIGRDRGSIGDIDFATFNWDNYDVIVIDESHNFRNNLVGTRDKNGELRKSRYRVLLEDILKKGVKTKVLMLSATPVNNDLQDLRNQIHLMTEGNDRAFTANIGINSMKQMMTEAQRTFARWAKQPHRQVSQLLTQLPSSFFRVLDEITIARSRAHITKYYAQSAQQIAFPTRRPPVSVSPHVDTQQMFPSYAKISQEIDGYKLAIFSPSQYVLPQYRTHYQHKNNDPFSQGDREHYLIGMMKVNFLKRLESSVYSFGLTLSRTINKINQLENLILEHMHQQSPATLADVELADDRDDDEFQEGMQKTVGKLQFLLAHLDLPRWLNDIRNDREQLKILYNSAQQITPERDYKLHLLYERIRHKIDYPSTMHDGTPNRKVIIFTAFADTAEYLYQMLYQRLTHDGVQVAMVSGGGTCATTFGLADFQTILTNFAPRAKRRADRPSMPQSGEIDVLIATDCIAEGQNLQDCDLLINYDIHWNPVRIIQRFGRIDRIGSPNAHIGMINFWPTDDLNAYINLRNRVESRMALVDLTATGQDNVLSPHDMAQAIADDMSYRDKQLQKLINGTLDIDSDDHTVSLTNFTLEDFRRELLNYIDKHHTAIKQAPKGLYALTRTNPLVPEAQPGVIFCLQQKQTTDTGTTLNPIQPYFLVYIRNDGNILYNFMQPKQALEAMRLLSTGQQHPDEVLCRAFDQQTANGHDMHSYSAILGSAIRHIRQAMQQRIATKVTHSRDFVIPTATEQIHNEDDFTLITWMVINHE